MDDDRREVDIELDGGSGPDWVAAEPSDRSWLPLYVGLGIVAVVLATGPSRPEAGEAPQGTTSTPTVATTTTGPASTTTTTTSAPRPAGNVAPVTRSDRAGSHAADQFPLLGGRWDLDLAILGADGVLRRIDLDTGQIEEVTLARALGAEARYAPSRSGPTAAACSPSSMATWCASAPTRPRPSPTWIPSTESCSSCPAIARSRST